MKQYHYISSGKQDSVYVLDLSNFELKEIATESLKKLGIIDGFDCTKLSYIGDKYSVVGSNGTLIGEDELTQTYIIAFPNKSKKLKLNLIILDKSRLAYYSQNKRIRNTHKENLLKLTDRLEKLRNYSSVYMVTAYKDNKRVAISDFYSSIENKSKQKEQTQEQKKISNGAQNNESEAVKNENEKVINSGNAVEKNKVSTYEKNDGALLTKSQSLDSVNETIRQKDKQIESLESTINKLEKILEQQKQREESLVQENLSLKQRLSSIGQLDTDIIQRKSDLDKREELLAIKEQKLKEAMCKLEDKPAYAIAEVVMDIKNVFTLKETPVKPRDKSVVLPRYTYEMILKSLSSGDIVNIPKTYIDTIEHTKLRFLQDLYNNKGYASLEQIQFCEGSKESLIAIMEFNNDTDEVKLYICREFGPERVSQDDIILYTTAYLRLQKDMLILDKNKLTALESLDNGK